MKKLICLIAIIAIALCLPVLAEDNSMWDFDAHYCELNGYSGAAAM